MTNPSFWKNKRVFITGHTGFKGAWLCKILELFGARIYGYALEPATQPNLFSLCDFDIESFIRDIRDFDALQRAMNIAEPEIVIHMAAQPLVLDSYKDPKYTYEVNVMGAVNLLECVRGSDSVRAVLNVTTDKVYLDLNREEGYQEDERLNGYDPYSNSKSCSELVTSCFINSFFKRKDIAVSTARSGNVIGGGDFSANRIIPDCARALARGERISVRNPFSIRPYQHVLDTLFAYLLIVEKQYEDKSVAGAYNIGPDADGCATTGDLANYFCAAWGDGASWEHTPTDLPHESALLTLDCSKIKRALGWEPVWDIKEATAASAQWYKLFYGNEDTKAETMKQIKAFAARYLDKSMTKAV